MSPLLANPLLTVDAAELGLQAESSIAAYVTSGIVLLLVATAVALLSRRLGVPYVTGLVLAGLAITDFLPQSIGLDSSLILNLFLPILLFEAAINTDVSRLRSTVKPIVLLAGPGVIVASGVTATILKYGLGLDWTPALLLGTILAITDTVSVIAVFKEITVPSRLITIVEGESLFNDGVALVLFNLISKVGTLTLSRLASAKGFLPALASFRAAAAFSRASASVTSFSEPSPKSLRRPSTCTRSSQLFAPEGLTRR
nr:cation:proton antiporter [Leptolyngbya sp. 7M]